MDFHTLSRKQLQSLCKKNKIPANITNLAMAHALTSLPQVEGLDEFLNPTEVDGGTPAIRDTVTQRKAESTRFSRSRSKNVEVGQDSNLTVLPDTPVAVPPPSNRRRKALPVSNRGKKEVDVVIDIDDDNDNDNGVHLKHMARTPALSRSRSRATSQTVPAGTTTYNTRRSTRLLEKKMSNMTLIDTQDMARNNLEQEMNSVSDQTQDSAETKEGKTGELEVSSLENYTELDEAQLFSGIDNDVGIGFQADAKEDAAGAVDSSELEIETIQDALFDEATKDANMPFTEQNDDALSVEVSIEANQSVAGSIPMSSASNDSEILKELVECNTDNQDINEYDDNKDKNNETSDGKYLQIVEHMFDAEEKAEDERNFAIAEEVLEHLEEDLEGKSEYLEESMAAIDKMDDFSDVTGTALAALEVSTESSVDRRSMDAENDFLESSLVVIAVHLTDDLMDNPEKLEAEAAFNIPVASSTTLDSEMDTSSENSMTVNDFCSESLAADKMNAENFTLESSLVDVVVHEAEDLKVNAAIIEDLKMDTSSENPMRVMDFCSESLAADKMNAENFTLESSLVDVVVHEAEDLKVNAAIIEDLKMDTSSENPMRVMDFCSESLAADKMNAENFTLESSLVDVVVHEAEDLKVNAAVIEDLKMDTSSENPMTVVDLCSESLAADTMNAQNVTLKSSLVDVVVHEAEDLKVNNAAIIEDLKLDTSSENSMTVMDFCSESLAADTMNAENATLESSLVDVVVHEAEDLKVNAATIEDLKMDTSSENPMTVVDLCSESLAADTMNAQNVTLKSSLVDVVVHEAEDLKVNNAAIIEDLKLDTSSENSMTVMDFCSESLAADTMNAENATLESSLVDVVVHGAEDLKVNAAIIEDLKLDTTSENSMTVMDFCSESLAADTMNAENVTLESSLVDVVVHEAEDLMVNAAIIEVKAQLQDPEEHTFDDCGASSAILAVEMDTTFKNSMTEIEFCSDSCGDTRSIIDAEKFTLESSLLDAGIPEAGELKDDYEKFNFKAQAEESEKYSQAEELKGNLNLKAQAEESKKFAEAEELMNYSEKVDFKVPAEECEEDAEAEYPKDNSERLDFKEAQPEASEEIATTKQESSVLAETVSVGPTKEQKTSDIPIQSVVADQLKGETPFPPQLKMNEFASEIQTVPKMISTKENMPNANMMKENLSTAELEKKSVRELKKMLMNLTLNDKPNCKINTKNVVKEVEKKRTALQTLPENMMTTSEAQNDG